MGIGKIKSLEELAQLSDTYKKQGKKIVHCHGCFDYIHFGHMKHFEKAKELGDLLFVTLTPDKFVKKGPGRPFYNEDLRLEFLSGIEYIDYLSLNRWETAIETIKLIKPDLYVKGKEVLDNKSIDEINTDSEKISNLEAEKKVLESIGGKLILTDEITFSSSRIINQITSALSGESKQYIESLRKKCSVNQIIDCLESLKGIKAIIIGDSVLDRYISCWGMEKSGKESLISYKYLDSETHPGGVFAVANHLSGFTENINLVTCVGRNTYEFAESSLNNHIERTIFVQDSETIVKTRYVDSYKGNKIFQIYNTDELKTTKENEEKILKHLKNNLDRFDMVLIPDFGHGLITENLIEYFYNCEKFLAINCQLNAGNLGYNFINKYKRANFVSLNERELRLPFQEKTGDIKIPIEKLRKCLNVNKINITSGKFGSTYYQDGDIYGVPSFIKEPLDTIGSGDAAFALTSLLSYNKTDPYLIPFLGNCIGGLATRIIGNRRAVDSTELKKFISYMMK